MLGHGHVVVPVVSKSAHVAELALDALGLDQRVASDDAGLPLGLALEAHKRCFIDFVAALLALSGWKLTSNVVFHVDLQNPVTDLVSILGREEVLLRQRDVVRRRNVGFLELRVVSDAVVVWVLDRIVEVDVAVQEDEGHVVVASAAVRLTSIVERLVRPDLLAVAQEGSAQLG